MRIYSFYASQIDYFKDQCVKLLALNSLRTISQKDLESFISKLSDLYEFFNSRDINDYFAIK